MGLELPSLPLWLLIGDHSDNKRQRMLVFSNHMQLMVGEKSWTMKYRLFQIISGTDNRFSLEQPNCLVCFELKCC